DDPRRADGPAGGALTAKTGRRRLRRRPAVTASTQHRVLPGALFRGQQFGGDLQGRGQQEHGVVVAGDAARFGDGGAVAAVGGHALVFGHGGDGAFLGEEQGGL